MSCIELDVAGNMHAKYSGLRKDSSSNSSSSSSSSSRGSNSGKKKASKKKSEVATSSAVNGNKKAVKCGAKFSKASKLSVNSVSETSGPGYETQRGVGKDASVLERRKVTDSISGNANFFPAQAKNQASNQRASQQSNGQHHLQQHQAGLQHHNGTVSSSHTNDRDIPINTGLQNSLEMLPTRTPGTPDLAKVCTDPELAQTSSGAANSVPASNCHDISREIQSGVSTRSASYSSLLSSPSSSYAGTSTVAGTIGSHSEIQHSKEVTVPSDSGQASAFMNTFISNGSLDATLNNSNNNSNNNNNNNNNNNYDQDRVIVNGSSQIPHIIAETDVSRQTCVSNSNGKDDIFSKTFNARFSDGCSPTTKSTKESTADEIDVKPNFELLQINAGDHHKVGFGTDYQQHPLQSFNQQQHYVHQQQQQHWPDASPPEHQLYPDHEDSRDGGVHSSERLASVKQPQPQSSAIFAAGYPGESHSGNHLYFPSNSKLPSPLSYAELPPMAHHRKYYPNGTSEFVMNNAQQGNIADEEDDHDNEEVENDELMDSGESFPQDSSIYYHQGYMYQQHQLHERQHQKHLLNHNEASEMLPYEFENCTSMSSYGNSIVTTEAHQHHHYRQNHMHHQPYQHAPPLHTQCHDEERHRQQQHLHHHHHHHLHNPQDLTMTNEEQKNFIQGLSDSSCSLATQQQQMHQQQQHFQSQQDRSPHGDNITPISSIKYPHHQQHHLQTLSSIPLPTQAESMTVSTTNVITTAHNNNNNNNNNSSLNNNTSNYHLASLSPAATPSESQMFPSPHEDAVSIYSQHQHHLHPHHHQQQLQHHQYPHRANLMYIDPSAEAFSYEDTTSSGIPRENVDLSGFQPFSSAVLEDASTKDLHPHHLDNNSNSPVGTGCMDSRKPMAMIYPWMKKSQTGKCK
ncbi:hypothetical protein PoB_000531800 [Plakobranchus ocellatus]|uniref:Uncharacterized protein n=1 Tax=Plakobranchus ocellatus TaxID=259542 RepID=A0AAV3Y8I0_9GAST|nr:hypothetical protein PoB_000531800 [Plakobranchus ocellatus]